ncbi:MAG: hypothetical protein RBS19_10355 [Bacteroidales bacterium]|nr:hypothetical protein [Bacteroidales bacterium]MDY0217344.1 hypothetical protein [Bacteroidales bacterium]
MYLSNKTPQEKFYQVRKDFQVFYFESFEIQEENNEINIVFHFSIDRKIFFNPEIKFPYNAFFDKSQLLDKEQLNSIVFHMGMIELISYWKSACPPIIHLVPFSLTEEQQAFWRKIYFHGLGEFFHINKIETNINDFFQFRFENENVFSKIDLPKTSDVMIPVGGGKDSVVTLEIIREMNLKAVPFIINPRAASFQSAMAAGYSENEIIVINRTIDNQLLQLNKEGFLNGHTPFSAMLAFSGILVAFCCKIPNMALSNESSANEASIIGTNINHQYSKSFEFETDFRNYVHENLSKDFNYYSLLRPLSELQIAALFSKTDKYNLVFKSCNVGSKDDIWCCNCSKCLFTYIMLSPFIKAETMLSIFGENLFEKASLWNTLLELSGQTEEKPFECVGTIEEVNIALCEIIKQKQNVKLPILLQKYMESESYQKYNMLNFNDLLKEFNSEHHLPVEQFEFISKKLA